MAMLNNQMVYFSVLPIWYDKGVGTWNWRVITENTKVDNLFAFNIAIDAGMHLLVRHDQIASLWLEMCYEEF